MEAPGIEPAKRQPPDTVEQQSGSIGVQVDPADVPDRASKCPIDRGDVTESSPAYSYSRLAFSAYSRALSFVGKRPNAVVIVTADHGEEFGDHGGRYHGTSVYEEQVRVPLVVWATGAVAPKRSRKPAFAGSEELSDVVETALAKALVLAAEAKRWDVVSQIARELERRGILIRTGDRCSAPRGSYRSMPSTPASRASIRL